MSDKIKVQYMGKERDVELVSEGIAKTGHAFLVKCSLKGTWHYCSPERMIKLAEKAGSREAVGLTYKSREGKAEEKNAALAIAAKKLAAEKAAKDAAEKAKGTPPATTVKDSVPASAKPEPKPTGTPATAGAKK